MLNAANKAAKEAFVAGHDGTSMLEISAVVGVVPLAAFVYSSMVLLRGWTAPEESAGSSATAAPPEDSSHCSGTLRRAAAGLLAEFGAVILPAIAAMMGADPHSLLLSIAAAAGVAALLIVGRLGRQLPTARHHAVRVADRLASRRTQFISNYRGAMMLCTCIAILSVDFHAFPRRFAKAETFGTGLMDVGVGSFVVASGLVSASRRGSDGSGQRRSLPRTSTLHVLALLALGFVRLLATRGVDYQHPVGEYGVHWNFFFTLAVVKLLTALLPLSTAHSALTAGALIVAAHQLFLSAGGGINIVHAGARGPNLLSLNKEGLLSLPGYWSLHLLSVGASRLLSAARSSAAEQARLQQSDPVASGWAALQPVGRWVAKLMAATAVLWLATLAATAVQPVSRRACNAAYVLWMLAFNMQVLMLFAAGNALAGDGRLVLLEAANRHMLPLFLLANLLTGLINLSIDTLSLGDWAARGFVMGYALILCSAVTAVPARRVAPL